MHDQSLLEGFLQDKSPYDKLKCFAKAEAIYDLTFYFAHKYFWSSDRTIDQMVQSARSGKQNIAEGRTAATTSRESEIKLYNVARGSLVELKIDYEDYLRTRNLERWRWGHPRLKKLIEFSRDKNDTEIYMALAPKCEDFELANLCLTLIHQTIKMFTSLIYYAKKDFLENGGIKEEMYKARVDYRNRNGF